MAAPMSERRRSYISVIHCVNVVWDGYSGCILCYFQVLVLCYAWFPCLASICNPRNAILLDPQIILGGRNEIQCQCRPTYRFLVPNQPDLWNSCHR